MAAVLALTLLSLTQANAPLAPTPPPLIEAPPSTPAPPPASTVTTDPQVSADSGSRTARLVLGSLVGAIGGTAGAYGLAMVGTEVGGALFGCGLSCGIGTAIGGIIGFFLGTAGPVYAIGRLLDSHAEPWAPIVGVALGIGALYVIYPVAFLVAAVAMAAFGPWGLGVLSLAPAIGAAIFSEYRSERALAAEEARAAPQGVVVARF